MRNFAEKPEHVRQFLMLLFFLAAICTMACQKEKKKNVLDTYKGPVAAASDVKTIYSDSARTKIRLETPRQLEFANGDREFPKGITVFFYNEKEQLESKLTSNYARYDRQTEIYTATGNVVVQNLIEQKRLNSEELKWNRNQQRVYTDKFVKIETPKEILTGTGLTAAENFSSYKILKLSGVISLEETE